MADSWLLIVTLGLVLAAAVVLMVRLLANMRTSQAWSSGWKEVAKDKLLTYDEMYGQSSINGMYRGRLVNLLGSLKAGTSILVTTNNWNNNHLLIQSKGIASARLADPDAGFSDGLSIQSRSSEFSARLFSDMALRRRLAPLGAVPNLTLTLSGEELGLRTPAVIHKPQEVIEYLDILSDLAGEIEATRD